MTSLDAFNPPGDTHEEIQKILALLKEKHGATEQLGINSVGLRMDRIREKLATSQTSGVCLWCGSKADSLTCLYGHVLVDASLLVVTEIYDNSPRRK